MQDFWILLLVVHTINSCAAFLSTQTYHEVLMYGQKLSIKLPTEAHRLVYNSVDESQKTTLWSRFSLTKRGRVTGSSGDHKFVIDSVTYEDQGTYTLFNFWNKKTSIHLLKVIVKTSTQNCVVGESLSIHLIGLPKNEATLHFSNEDFNLTLVERGSPVGNLHPDYMGRIQVTSNRIEVLNVNVSDVGNYTLSDGLNRKVKIVSLNLVDHHEEMNAAPFMSLLLLLGIPPCVFCCYKKKIYKKNRQHTATVKYDDPIIPPGPPPAYTSFVGPTPAGPTPDYALGYPESIVHPSPNSTFPPHQPCNGDPGTSPPNPPYIPSYPAAPWFPPDQPPQWGLDNQPASAGFSPVIYNAHVGPKPAKEDIPPTTPLLTSAHAEVPQPPAPYTGHNMLNSSDNAVQFNIGMGKDTNVNFL